MNLNEFKIEFKNWIKGLRVKKTRKRPSENTIKAYSRAIDMFVDFLEEKGFKEVNQESVQAFEKHLNNMGLKTSTFNLRAVTLNKCFSEIGLKELRIDTKESKKSTVNDNTITESDYTRLIRWADKLGMEREKLIMQTLAGTGIRISELQFFTVETLKESKNKIDVVNKGKERSIIIPQKVRKELLTYARKNDIKTGIIFHAQRSNLKKATGETEEEFEARKKKDIQNKLIDKACIWKKLKYIAGKARVKKSKVHAHSFRHLYAQRYLKLYPQDIANLANLMGHSSIETTRLYATLQTEEQVKRADSMFSQNKR